jgi:hypothetical protein
MPARSGGQTPTGLTIHAYQVGFGDCFLLAWHYPERDRFVLIDFGSNGQPKSASKTLLLDIANDIKKVCGEAGLDAVVLTHRHKDHIAGFATGANGKGPGDVIRSLKPAIVVQPWTEDPTAKPDAGQATSDMTHRQALTSSFDNMHHVSAGVAAEASALASTETESWRRQLLQGIAFLGEEGLQNEAAVRNLQQMSDRHVYASHMSSSGLSSILPGVAVTVLGPPTLNQSSAIEKERARDAAEFWMLQGAAASQLVAGDDSPFPEARAQSGNWPPYARWFIPRVRRLRAEGLLGIVRIMDDALNNTSVILLFEVNGTALLFPGDAQIENWEYTLSKPDLMRRLAKVTFYKVGHHGSRNATPKSLWNNFDHRGPPSKRDRLVAMVSTMGGKYGHLAEGTEVPRRTLMTALRNETALVTTQTLRGKKLKHVLTIPIRSTVSRSARR